MNTTIRTSDLRSKLLSLATAVPEHVVKRLNVLPLKKENNILYVAMADTGNMAAVDDLRLVSRCTVRAQSAEADAD